MGGLPYAVSKKDNESVAIARHLGRSGNQIRGRSGDFKLTVPEEGPERTKNSDKQARSDAVPSLTPDIIATI